MSKMEKTSHYLSSEYGPSPSRGSTLGHCIAVDTLLCAEIIALQTAAQKGTNSVTDPFITDNSRALSHALTFDAKSSLFCCFNSLCFPGFYMVFMVSCLKRF